MLSNYFKEFDKKIVKRAAKKAAPKAKAKAKKGAAKKAVAKTQKGGVKLDLKALKERLEGIIPTHLAIEKAKPVDMNGFSPDGADLIIYRPYCRDIVEMMGGLVPFELLHGTCFTTDELNRKTLPEVLNRVGALKKMSKLAQSEENSFNVPAFIIAGDTSMSMLDIKNDILNYYMNNNVPGDQEFELLLIFNKGIVIRNWREERSYISLETGEDSIMWFFILMNEYLEAEHSFELDFRNYIKTDKTYSEY